MFSNCSYPYHSREREAPGNETGSAAGRSSQSSLEADPAIRCAALQTLASGRCNAVVREQYLHSMDIASQQLGNRAFMRWIGALHAVGQGGQAQSDTMQGRQYPGRSAPLQLMSKKKKKKEEPAAEVAPVALTGAAPGTGSPDLPEATLKTTPDAGAQAVPELVAASPGKEPGAAATPAEKKKKKKPRVQVALNALRAGKQDEEGVEAFRRYIEAEIGETALLHTLVERLNRAQDLGGRQQPALDVVTARLRALDPPAAAPARGDVARTAAIVPMKLILNHREQEFIDTCLKGDVRKLRQLLKLKSLDVNLSTQWGTPLSLAALYGHGAIARELLSIPAIDVNQGQWIGATPLFLAASHGRMDLVRLLLEARGINPNLGLEEKKTTPLIIAAHKGREEVVKLLVADNNVRVNLRQADWGTALFAAAEADFPGIVEALVSRGADVNLTLCDGSPPLSVAAHKGNIEVLKHLLRAPYIKVNQLSGQLGTALYYAAEAGHKEVVALLLGNGADPNGANDNQLAPLHIACLYGHAEIVEMLLNKGADMELKTEQKYTSYDIAHISGHQEIIRLMEERRPDKAVQQASAEELPVQDQPQQLAPVPGYGAGSGPEADGTHQPDVTTAYSPEAAPASPSRAAKSRTPLGLAKTEFIRTVLEKLANDWLDPVDGIRLLEQANIVADLDGLCTVFNRLAHVERNKIRSGRRQLWRGIPAAARAPAGPYGFVLGEKQGLNAETVEDEIKRHLEQAYHRFVSQTVNDMEFGRGKPTSGYPRLLHVSAGVPGVGSCSVFFYTQPEGELIRIVGIGYHRGRGTYRLGYAISELQGVHTLRLY